MSESAARSPRESERLLRAITDSARDAIVMIDDGGTVTFWSPAAETLFGYTAAEVRDRNLHDLIVPEPYHAAFLAAFPAFRQSGRGGAIDRTIELTARHKDGRDIAVSLSLSAIAIEGRWHAVGVVRDVTDHMANEHALRRSEAKYRELFEHAPLGIYSATTDGRFLDANRALLAMLGYDSVDELFRLGTADLFVEPERRRPILAEIEQRDKAQAETQWRRKDGSVITVLLNARAKRDSGGAVDHFEVLVDDVTERRSVENQFRQAQRMEAVGRLASGVAHDFNNVLTVIVTDSELLLDGLEADHPMREDLEEIRAVALKAAALTRQLLAFSRKQVLQLRVLSVNAVVEAVTGMLQRLVGEDVTIAVSLGGGLAPVRADPGQLEQVLMNLVVNSRDAMPEGGRVTLATSNVELDASFAGAHPGSAPGPHVLLAVRDTGTGMTPDVRAHIFEPFFTTKDLGKGTGLGLATVYGIVKQLGGFVDVESALGRGTVVGIYLPSVDAPLDGPETGPDAPPVSGGSETVLLVEDDTPVRRVLADTLQKRGYRVLAASDGRSALELAAAEPGPIALLLTDVIMPGMSGREVADGLAAERPGLRVVYMSGYTDEAVVRLGVLDAGVRYLQKPFNGNVLARNIREALDGT